ncbi:MAG: hypothetical protein ACERKZ_15595 [Lachnotalea sp.]
MPLKKGFKNKMGKLTYDKIKLNAKVLTIKKSFDEVNKIINGK